MGSKKISFYEFNKKYPSKYDRMKLLAFMSDDEIEEIIKQCQNVFGKLFYRRFQRNSSMIENLYYDDGKLLYRGVLNESKPYGRGTVYWDNGNIYQAGIFDIKGLIAGREYYPNGNIRFEGTFVINKGYGPNYPEQGKYYDTDGNLLYEGEFKFHISGSGYPLESNVYGKVVQDNKPNISYLTSEDYD